MSKFRSYVTATLLALALATPLLVPAGAAAACPGNNTSKGQVLNGVGATGNDCDTSGFTNAVSAAVEILSIVAGIIAVIMLIISGFRYITSGGESGRVAAAKNTLIYALVGIAIVALAQFLVHFVFTTATTSTDKPVKKQSYLEVHRPPAA